MSESLQWALLVIVVAQQAFWSFQVHRLVDKLMSRTYYDYETSRHLSDPRPVLPNIDEPMEDLRGLNGINPF